MSEKKHESSDIAINDLQKEYARQNLQLGRTDHELQTCLEALKGLKELCENSHWDDEVMRLAVESVVLRALKEIYREPYI